MLFILFLLLIPLSIFSMEQPTKAPDFSVCEEIKQLKPDGRKRDYKALARKLEQFGVDSCACGLYLIDKKINKAVDQISKENHLSATDQDQIKYAHAAYVRRPSAKEVNLTMNSGVNTEVARHITATIQYSQGIRQQQFSDIPSNLTQPKPENLHVAVKWPQYTILADAWTSASCGFMHQSVIAENLQKTAYNKIQLGREHNNNILKGIFNHEFGHYFFADMAMGIFLAQKIFKQPTLDECIKPKNGVQKFSFAQEYRADWFVGLFSKTNQNFEYSKEALEMIKKRYPNDNDSTHPPLKKRIDWLKRWINLKDAENKKAE